MTIAWQDSGNRGRLKMTPSAVANLGLQRKGGTKKRAKEFLQWGPRAPLEKWQERELRARAKTGKLAARMQNQKRFSLSAARLS